MNKMIYNNNDQAKLLYLETYGCQMSVADSEVVYAIMETIGYAMTEVLEEADVVLINTCSCLLYTSPYGLQTTIS